METTQTSKSDFEKAKAKAFAGYALGLINGGFLTLMMSVGHKTRLFDVMATLPPSSSEQIARKAKLNERYVREWLGSMVTGHIVDYDGEARTYLLPPEHAAMITRAAGIGNLASFAQLVSLLGEVEDRIVECFQKGGGLTYAAYPRFHKLMAEGSARVLDARLIDTSLPLVKGLAERLKNGIEVLDVGCGSGHAINLMARAFPKSSFAGYDFSKEGIRAAKDEARRLELTNAKFTVKDVAKWNEPLRYDLITAFDSIHDQAQPTRVLQSISKALRSDGVFFMVDVAASSNLLENIGLPLAPALYGISTMHCMTVSLAYKGEGLGAMWGEQLARQKLKEAGFNHIDVRKVPGDILNSYYIATKN